MKVKKVLSFSILLLFITLTSCGVSPVVKELNKINDNDSRYWAEFIKKNGINAIDYENDTVLLYALEKNNSELVRACIKCGADVNLTKKLPPLIVYPVLNKDVELVKLFLDKGAIVIGNNSYQDSLQYIVEGFSQYNPFDDNAKKIIDLLFTKISLDDINGIASDNYDGYFENYNSGSTKAFEAIFDKIIAKGYELTEQDIYNISGFFSKEKLYEVILNNLDKVSINWVFVKLADFNPYREDGSNDTKYEVFKSILQAIEINESNFSDIDKELGALCGLAFVEYDYHNMDNLSEKLKEIVSLLKSKKFNIQNSKAISYPSYQLMNEFKEVLVCETNIEYWLSENEPERAESEKKVLEETVDKIKKSEIFKLINYFISEGFSLGEEYKKMYDPFINKYGDN